MQNQLDFVSVRIRPWSDDDFEEHMAVIASKLIYQVVQTFCSFLNCFYACSCQVWLALPFLLSACLCCRPIIIHCSCPQTISVWERAGSVHRWRTRSDRKGWWNGWYRVMVGYPECHSCHVSILVAFAASKWWAQLSVSPVPQSSPESSPPNTDGPGLALLDFIGFVWAFLHAELALLCLSRYVVTTAFGS